jgi:NAD(P)-dependent dehydrogenase (short-subunit alcohol dehydrogenase family)
MPSSPVFLLIGAAGGIGTALTHQLHQRGYRLVLSGRTLAPLQALAQEVGGHALQLDATDADATSAAVARVVAEHGRLDGVVNLAGSILLKPAHLTTPAEWAQVLATNLGTAFSVVRAAAPVLGKDGGGSIVLLSTAAARLGLPNHEAIAAAKAGVTGLALSAAATYAQRNVRVNVVAPGLVETPLSARITSHPASRQASEAMHALGRIGSADDVARVIAFLLDPANHWITGQVYGVDGGLGTLRGRP